MQTNRTKRFTVLDLPGVLQTTSIASQPKSNSNSAVSADKSQLPSVKKSVESSSEENLYKSTLTIEQRVAVAMTVGEEVVTEEELTAMSRKYGIKALFFDGRGGPPARGGGKTHKFYASLGPKIENNEIQITVQGQTISSNFGTLDSCRYNLENLLSAGATNQVFNKQQNILSENEKQILKDRIGNTISEGGEEGDKEVEKEVEVEKHANALPDIAGMRMNNNLF